MIGKAKWFKRRKYGGWGVTPKTWQGWVYILLFMLPILIFQMIPGIDESIKLKVTIIWIVLIVVDLLHVMRNLDNDERETKIEAISERNAAWSMMIVLVIGILYQSIRSAFNNNFEVDVFLFGALFIGAIVKSVSNYMLEKKGV